MAAEARPGVAPDDLDTDPNERVHHHARIGAERRSLAAGPIVTLCGLVLPEGPRPGATRMPCCPMCAEEMHRLGQQCRWA